MGFAAFAFVTVATAMDGPHEQDGVLAAYNFTPANKEWWQWKRFQTRFPNKPYNPQNAQDVANMRRVQSKTPGETEVSVWEGRNKCTINGFANLDETHRFTITKIVAKKTKLSACRKGSHMRLRSFELTVPRNETDKLTALHTSWKSLPINLHKFLEIQFGNKIEFEGYSSNKWTAGPFGSKCRKNCPKKICPHAETVKMEKRGCKLTIKFIKIIPGFLHEIVSGVWKHRKIDRGAAMAGRYHKIGYRVD